MPNPPNKSARSQRVAERLKAELMEMFLRGEVRDPAVADVYVTRVALTDDLQHARVYVRLTRPEVDDKQRSTTLRALERAGGHLRRELGPRLRLKYMPDLKFFWDEGLDRAARVEAVLEEIRREHEGES
ncbi:MAG TPA: 30S ribosome-binding factor RbfA [Polyangiales bacterium]